MKKCTKCDIEKSFDLFGKRASSKDGYQSTCKTCESVQKKAYYQANKQHIQKSVKERYTEKREEVLAQKAHYYKATHRPRHLMNVYKLSEDDYNTILVKQNNSCAICGVSADSLNTSLCVDHNHQTNDVRGLLCRDCNVGIGLLQDRPSVIKNAYQYLITRGHYGPEAA